MVGRRERAFCMQFESYHILRGHEEERRTEERKDERREERKEEGRRKEGGRKEKKEEGKKKKEGKKYMQFAECILDSADLLRGRNFLVRVDWSAGPLHHYCIWMGNFHLWYQIQEDQSWVGFFLPAYTGFSNSFFQHAFRFFILVYSSSSPP
jgi:hypothetical protein